LRRLYRHHPLVCAHPSLPPAVLLSAKLLALHALWWRIRRGFDPPFLPFFTAWDHPAIVALWPWLLGIVFGAGVLLLGFNLAPRLGAAGVGSALLLDLLASRLRYSNNTLFFDLLLLVIALSGPHDSRRVGLRAQIALLYAGAAINKLFLPDWQSGQFFRFWTHDVLHLEWVARLEQSWGTSFSIGMSWLTIAVELLLAALVCWPRGTRIFVALALAFHVGMLIFTGGALSWIFFRVMLVAYLGLLQGPVGAPAAAPLGAPLWRLVLAWPAAERDWRGWVVWACVPVWWILRHR
jgi:hypothetical protein